MGIFLNNIIPFENYNALTKSSFFVDKTLLLNELIQALEKDSQKYFCITRPRRFGKSVMANMVSAFFGKATDSGKLFAKLNIATINNFNRHLNRHNIIYIDFSRMPEHCDSYRTYIDRISQGIKNDLIQTYPDLHLNSEDALWDIFQTIFEKTQHKFMFIMDEWDFIFHKTFITKNNTKSYLEFLRDLLKDQAYVELAYMTGILPIAKYSSGSEINMFKEYDMVTREKFSEYFGFSDTEVDALFQTYLEITEQPKITREDLRIWYDGYSTKKGEKLYNPRSITCALEDNELANYWTSSGPYDELFYYIRHNLDDVRNDLALMISGERIRIKLQGYGAVETKLTTKNQIYSAMVVYGLLTYEHGEVFIPNKELMDKYDELLLLNEDLGYIHRLARESERMLNATLTGDTQTMVSILKLIHDTESPILSYNHETELSSIVNLVYLAARDRYFVKREDKSGEGYVDFIFYPIHKNEDALILELKIDSTPEEAIGQIKDKQYALRLTDKLGEKPKYTGRILAVGISYHKRTKEHFCKVEIL